MLSKYHFLLEEMKKKCEVLTMKYLLKLNTFYLSFSLLLQNFETRKHVENNVIFLTIK